MPIPFSGIITPKSIVFTSPDGKPFNVTDAHLNFEEMKEVFKKLQKAIKDNDEELVSSLHVHITELADVSKEIEKKANNTKVHVEDGVVYFMGEPIHNAITERIIWGMSEGYDMDPYVNFLDNLMDNPSKRSVDELYGFLEKNRMGITEDGYIIAYKKVREDYTDIHTGKFDNSPGKSHRMPRNMVDDNKDKTCSDGFHFCAFSYLPYFGSGPGNRVVIVKVNPRDVVSIPVDYNGAKARCCYYEVIGEYDGADKEDILGSKPVFGSTWQSDADLETDEDDGWDDGYDDGYEDYDSHEDDWEEESLDEDEGTYPDDMNQSVSETPASYTDVEAQRQAQQEEQKRQVKQYIKNSKLVIGKNGNIDKV